MDKVWNDFKKKKEQKKTESLECFTPIEFKYPVVSALCRLAIIHRWTSR